MLDSTKEQTDSTADAAAPDLHRTLVEQAQVGLFVVQANRLRFVNPKLAEMLGYSVEELLDDMPGDALTAPAYRSVVREQVRNRLAGMPGSAYDIQCQRKDGSLFDARVWGLRIDLGGMPADLVSLHDISELKMATRSAERRATLLAQAEELAHIGSEEVDLLTGAVTRSSGMYLLFGEASSTEPSTRSWLYARVPAEERPFVQAICEGVQPGEPFEFQHRILRKDGSKRTVLHCGRVEVDDDGQPVRTYATLQDITLQREIEEALHDLANLDPATRLPNRDALLTRLDEAVQSARREGQAICLLLIEIDQFRTATESLGYSGGDQLLHAVAQRLATSSPQIDVLAHLGGGEFAALLCQPMETAEMAAQALAHSLTTALAEPFTISASEIFTACDVGVALFPTDADSAELLLNRAQAAMRQAHEMGSGAICFYTEEANTRATQRLANETALRRALDRNELYVSYQPQVDLRSGKVVGVEALARWKDAVRGEIAPSEFIALAERTGLILRIGEWVLRTACEDCLRWQAAGLAPVRVGVNLSMHQLQQPDIARRVQTILLETGLDPNCLGIEITESMLLTNVDHVVRTLTELKAIGVEIALDDFGTGYSNLSSLSKLPIDILKIDKSFVHDVTAAPQDVSITRALINMAHGLQMKVLAEGVENDGQLALLVANHCDLIQGYYFSRAVSPAQIETMLRDDKRLAPELLDRSGRKRTLLLVDDEVNVLAALRRLLRKDGYHIVTADSGAQALQRLAENEVDVILSDQRMPGMTGVEFLRRAKELYPDTVRMSLSGYTELQSVTDAINEGAIYKFLTKPWDDERLRAHVSEAFRHKEVFDENRRLGDQVQSSNRELADVNDRLQLLLSSQRARIDRDEAGLVSARDVLENMPVPVIGFDAEGMVAFVSAEAQHLLFPTGAPLGQMAEEVLAPELLAIWQSSDGAHQSVVIAGRPFHAVCRNLGAGALTRGKLMVLTRDSRADAPT